jgi:hypothetical protein
MAKASEKDKNTKNLGKKPRNGGIPARESKAIASAIERKGKERVNKEREYKEEKLRG